MSAGSKDTAEGQLHRAREQPLLPEGRKPELVESSEQSFLLNPEGDSRSSWLRALPQLGDPGRGAFWVPLGAEVKCWLSFLLQGL